MIRETRALIARHSHFTPVELDEAIVCIEDGVPFARREAFRKVEGLCHPKAYGDLFMEGYPGGGWAWFGHLEKLQGACARAASKLEHEEA